MLSTPPNHRLRIRLRAAIAGLGIVALVLVAAGCRTQAEDKNYNYNNSLDPHQDTSNGSSGSGQVQIAYVDSLNDIVVLANTGTEDTDMNNWVLSNSDKSATYTFSGFTLSASAIVRVHSASTPSGGDTSTDLYTGSTDPNWGPTTPNNEAILYNDSSVAIDQCTNGDACWP